MGTPGGVQAGSIKQWSKLEICLLCTVLSKALCVIKTGLLRPQTPLLQLSRGSRVHSISTLSAYWLSCALPEAEQKLEFRFRAWVRDVGHRCRVPAGLASSPGPHHSSTYFSFPRMQARVRGQLWEVRLGSEAFVSGLSCPLLPYRVILTPLHSRRNPRLFTTGHLRFHFLNSSSWI